MLVIHPNSTCDVCLEGYSNGQNTPHAIVCGHSFCQGCLESLTRLTCPLCRTRFEPQDVRKLHIDRGQTPRVTPSSVADMIEQRSTSDDEAQRLQNDIARIVKEGAKVSELRRLLEDCRSWYKNQPPDQYDNLRVSFLLLYHLTETQKKLSAESDKVHEAQASCEAWQTTRDQLTKELKDADRKYQDLLQQSEDEKEAALAVEKSLRAHYEQLDAQWKGRYDNAVLECYHLREELRRVRYGPLSEQPRPIEVRQFYITDKPHKAFSNNDLAMTKSDAFDSLIEEKARLASKEAMFHLSPVPEILSPLPSAIQGFCALAEDDGDEDLKIKMKLAKIEDDDQDYDYIAKEKLKPMPYPLPQPRSTVPIPIPAPIDSHLSRQPSGLSMRMARNSDTREPVLSRSVSSEHVSRASSRSVSPSSRPVQVRHKSSSAYESKSKDQIATRQILGNDDQINSERWKAKLHDILDSPATSSSLHSNMSSRSDQFIEPLPTHLISRPSSSNSRSHTPPKLPLTAQHSSSSLSVHMDASTHRPPSVSHASKAAWQLENEKRERERERERERLRQASSNPSSLKDTTMVYSSTGEHRQRHGSGKGNAAKTHV